MNFFVKKVVDVEVWENNHSRSKLEYYENPNFYFSLGEDHEIREQINPATPRFYAYQFPNDNVTDAVLLQVSSTNDICMSVSVQNIQCPVFDLERNVEFDGFFQSVTQSGSITVSVNFKP